MTISPKTTAIPWTDAAEGIETFVAAPPRLLVACDFDGTLTDIVSDPDRVQLPPATLAALRNIQTAPGLSLAVISGRSLTDLIPRVPLSNITLAGNHGLEIRGLGLDGERHEAKAARPLIAATAMHLEEAIGSVPGLRVENKELSLTVHLRNVIASHREWVVGIVRNAAAGLSPLRLQEGNEVMEFLPAIAWDKGTALRQIMNRLGLPHAAAIYIGDDTTDESAFAVVRNGVGIRVGSPRETAARWTARDPAEVCQFLQWLAEIRMRTGRARARTSAAQSHERHPSWP